MTRVLPPTKNFLSIGEEHSSYEQAKIVILSAPYEHTVSYGGGTKRGPKALLEASQFVEFWDEDFKRELCFEMGIASLPPLLFNDRKDAEALDFIRVSVTSALNDGKFVVTLGGEHTISAAPIQAHFEHYPNMSVLQFDAHSDLRESYQGNRFSHASVMARVVEFFSPERIVQVGIRAQCIEEYEFIRQQKIQTYFACDINAGKYADWQQSIVDCLRDDVYITFDIDYFDPSIMPATGTPEPGGFLWDETIQLLKKIGSVKRIIGFDLVELAPIKQLPFPSFLAAKLTYKIMNAAFQTA